MTLYDWQMMGGLELNEEILLFYDTASGSAADAEFGGRGSIRQSSERSSTSLNPYRTAAVELVSRADCFVYRWGWDRALKAQLVEE